MGPEILVKKQKQRKAKMKYLFICYSKCSICKKAQKWLDEQQIQYEFRDIVGENPTAIELKDWIKRSDLPIKRFFNTSGMIYRDMNLKDKLGDMSEDEQIELLATNGMLVKRPLIIGKEIAIPGFKEALWEELL